MGETVNISESVENYLETILALETDNKVARAKDIAERLGVQKGSVSGALRILKEKGLINYKPYSFITLTAKGKKIAKSVLRRHLILKDFLENVLQISDQKAENAACRMEHAIDEETLERLLAFIDYIKTCPRAGDNWLASFVNYYKTHRHDPEKCNKCINELTQLDLSS
ncbi:MAG: metal-dependent transcriptional regulator [Desulfobulbales bacterium]|nr:metal-dependent transcriptional regulator [Desulfobulbales bacterium]